MSTSCDAVSCSIKPAVHLHIGHAPSNAARSGVCVVDVHLPFGKPVNIERISFKNFYTASLSVRLLTKEPASLCKWLTAIRDVSLMENPHCEDGAQDYCSLIREQMLVEPDHVVQIRLILRQPSATWTTFDLEEINIYTHTHQDSEEVSDWLSELTLVDQDPDHVQELPDSQSVSCSIQQMLALTEVMKNNQNSSSIGRYQVTHTHTHTHTRTCF
ncbi:nicolin-1-like isoform X1 [Gouania willdenowi]|uniref:nicolin-1-like isoform X1 n=1 Tax=Gouania willdenowi TaxID=441366 RepID=UPI0010547D7D|nr:nicolin-1-like isoform X1 [Gouania willdenowi]